MEQIWNLLVLKAQRYFLKSSDVDKEGFMLPHQEIEDRIEGDKIILNPKGAFPKRIVIYENGQSREYRLIRTRKGKYQLVK